VVIQDGVDAGQTVPHLHVHVYPQYEDHEIDIQESESKFSIGILRILII